MEIRPLSSLHRVSSIKAETTQNSLMPYQEGHRFLKGK
jgi:hypothetical protein